MVGAQMFKSLCAMSSNAKAKVTTLRDATRLVAQAKLIPIDLGHGKAESVDAVVKRFQHEWTQKSSNPGFK